MAAPLPPAGQDDFVEEVIAEDDEDEPNFKEVVDVVRRMRNKPPGSEVKQRGRGRGTESLPTDGTNDFLPVDDDGSYSYSYSYDDDDGLGEACADETGFYNCVTAAVFSGEVTQDEAEAAFDAISGVEDGDWSTCAEFLQDPGLAAQCGSWTLGVCDDEYKAWTGCLFTTSFAQNGLDCQVDCDAVIGTPSRPSTTPPTEPGGSTRPPTADKDSDGALGLTTTLTAAAVAVAAAF